MAASININDLTPDQRRELGLKKPKETTFKKEDVRKHAILVLSQIAHLSQTERKRVLQHAISCNEV